MLLHYGNYTHARGEPQVSIVRNTLRSDTGEAYGYTERWTISGDLIGDGPADIDGKVRLLESAYGYENRDLYFSLPDGTRSQLALMTANSQGGNRVVQLPSYPTNAGAVYATHVPYTIIIEGDIITSGNVVKAWQESLSFSGGGPRYGHLETLASRPQKQLLRRNTVYRVTQAGSATGQYSYPSVPGPIWPSALVGAPSILRQSPTRKSSGDYEDYTVTWQYDFEAAVALSGQPNR